MPFIKCPHCKHSALSVASRCPGCGAALGALTLGPEHKGAIVSCLSCGHVVRSRSEFCPQCGTKDPARKPAIPRRTKAIAALVTFGVLVIGGWTQVAGRAHDRPAGSPLDHQSIQPAPLDTGAAVGPEPPPALQTRWTSVWANVRTRPQEGALVLEQLPPGTRIDAVRRPSGWWLIYLGGDSAGYIAGAVLSARPPDTSAYQPD